MSQLNLTRRLHNCCTRTQPCTCHYTRAHHTHPHKTVNLSKPLRIILSLRNRIVQSRQHSNSPTIHTPHSREAMDRFSTSFPTRSLPDADGRRRHGGQLTAAASRQDVNAYGLLGAVVGPMDCIRGMSLREANRIHCKATRERTRERERLLREVTHRVCCIVSPLGFDCSADVFDEL